MLKVHWFLPTAGDSRDVVASGADGHRRPPTIEYLAQVARAAEQLGFDAVLTPTGTWCEDAWISTAALLAHTERLRFLVAFRPGSITPTLAAQQAATFQRMSGGRLLLNVVTGGDPTEMARFGDELDHDGRYERTEEFLAVVRGAWSGEPFDFTGRHLSVRGATVQLPPEPVPEIYFGGASPAAERVAAAQADVYLAWGEPPEMVAERVERMRGLAEARGRSLRQGIRLHVIARDRASDAWAEADRILASMDPATVAAAQANFAKTQSVGQQRMAELHGGDPDRLVVAPNLWAGIGLVRGGAGTALVGSHDEVAERIAEYHEIGFDEFILSGHPHLEEAYWVGEGVLGSLRRAGLVSAAPPSPWTDEHGRPANLTASAAR
ncbi:MAG TPA: LLM class flavin-dependent oxidoreductase [Microthrixaceae bacterium]|nr:LLM class flavin-dependent oxidoreductase [Microthrixaceae bacterium]